VTIRETLLRPWWAIVRGYLRLIEPLVGWCVRRGVAPNTITVLGTLVAAVVGVLFAVGWVSAGGWTLGLLAFFDVIDGEVARRTGRATAYGAFLDATLDRVADACLLGGLVVLYATHPVHRSGVMVVVALVALIATQLTSYTRARADLAGIDLKGVGWLERPERITLLAAPQAFFGLRFEGRVLAGVVALLAAAGVVTVWQRMRRVAQG